MLAEARQAAQKQIQEAKAEAQAQSDKRLNEVKAVSLQPFLKHLLSLYLSLSYSTGSSPPLNGAPALPAGAAMRLHP